MIKLVFCLLLSLNLFSRPNIMQDYLSVRPYCMIPDCGIK